MSAESQEQINQRLTQGVAANTASIAVLAEGAATRYKGVKASQAHLPATGNFTGDLWELADTKHGWFWNGTQWEDGGIITKGADGTSPTATVTKAGHTATISITDTTGTTTATVTEPTATVSKVGNTATITIVDSDGTTHTATVNDGVVTGLDDSVTEGSSNGVKSSGIYSFVNSSVATNTANFKGTLDAETDLGLTKPESHENIATALNAHAFSPAVTNNDYCFVVNSDSAGNTLYDRFKATVIGVTATWAYEYTLNNSSFTANQWSAIQSGITSGKVSAYDAHVAATGSGTVHVPIVITNTDPGSSATEGTIYFITGS